MSSFIWSLIEVNVLIVLLCGAYFLVKNQLSFKQRRLLIFLSPVLAIGTVLLKSYVEISNYSIPIVELDVISIGEQVSSSDGANQMGALNFVSLENIYFFGIIILTLLLLLKIGRIVLFFLRNISVKQDSFRVYSVESIESFSFFNWIHIETGLLPEERGIVLEHEKMHARKKHSLELLGLEIIQIGLWFNPLIFILKRELINLHEYEIDAELYKKHEVNYMRFLLSYTFQISASRFFLTNHFYNKMTLKKRIENMKNLKQSKKGWLLIIPLFLVTIGFVRYVKLDTFKSLNVEAAWHQLQQNYDGVLFHPKYEGQYHQNYTSYLQEKLNYVNDVDYSQGKTVVTCSVTGNGEVVSCSASGGNKEIFQEVEEVVSSMPFLIFNLEDDSHSDWQLVLPI